MMHRSFAALAALFVGHAALTAANAQTLEKIARTNQIVVSYREAAVPFSYLLTPHKAVGFSMDVTEEIVDDVRKALRKPDLHTVYVPVTGQNRIPLLVNGTIDLECGSTTNTSARGKEVTFSTNYFYAGTRLMTKRESHIGDYADLAHKVVATVGGSTNEKALRRQLDAQHVDADVVLTKDYAEALKEVADDRAAALALDDVLLYGLRANASDPDMWEVVGEALQIEPYACMVRKDDPAFKRLVDGTLTRLMKSGEFARLYAKWFESPIPPRGANLKMPMSAALKGNLIARSDRPAQ
ncbi:MULTISPECIES: amino acid ABC transporter substrate-binding protein [unclassified Burkholderia]|uniref:amino acid ABC transporter substrate-binding protein n=1 Tax=unclassified Burkholderia TaxID=2613784 RepID=UPI000F5938FC|nr:MULTISPECIES: amino acid ABC transporter substrate-binding protein [unclassified Burkholderia]RQR33947.1 amino acid ABC transporter substrate-binding protein [Burkholderia sp. Bp9131]RQR66617.1 amino acid ABC transporter substrate-binding protein [Burkholderia sp. Bp9015]RQR92955.1 amino acid ABC transporter substrate-binding protein [Burkholderia sp. Bp8994]RQS20371.1 amino acid ABC transporter substrate-binding protein [Burkholderia sp. Bp8995]RQS37677.1 amino acid ABC transporter substra